MIFAPGMHAGDRFDVLQKAPTWPSAGAGIGNDFSISTFMHCPILVR